MGQGKEAVRTVAASGPTSYPSVRRVPSGSRVRRCNAPRSRASFAEMAFQAERRSLAVSRRVIGIVLGPSSCQDVRAATLFSVL